MKWMRSRFLSLAYIALVALVALIGCTSREDPAETLAVCGNHACGDLVMVTSDTSSDGYHYLDPSLAPSGGRVLFTADWTALPADSRYSEDDFFTKYRQIILLPLIARVEPEFSLADQGAKLVRLQDRTIPRFMVDGLETEDVRNYRKADPIWEDDNHIIFRLALPRGYRLFRADISNPDDCPIEPLVLEAEDSEPSGRLFQHFEPALSPDGNWLAFTRFNCLIPDSLETCTQIQLMVLDMTTAGANDGYDAFIFPVTNEYSRIEKPCWSPDGRRLVFSAGFDIVGESEWGTELYSIDFDTTGLATGEMALDNNLDRLTFTEYNAGDPIVGVFNTSPFFSNDGGRIFFVSTRRMPTTTHHDRNIWVIPADGSLDPEIYFYTRADDVDGSMLPDGSILLSSKLGFTTEMLNRAEEESYQRERQQHPNLTNLEMRNVAKQDRNTLELFEGVMSHLYVYRK